MNSLRLNGFTRSAIGLAIAAVVAPALAQNTTASVAGRVIGADGKPVAGATVTVLQRGRQRLGGAQDLDAMLAHLRQGVADGGRPRITLVD